MAAPAIKPLAMALEMEIAMKISIKAASALFLGEDGVLVGNYSDFASI
jgi:hypothetical protein